MPEIASLLSSAWLYPAIFLSAIVDAFVFLAPSELLVLAARPPGSPKGSDPSGSCWSRPRVP